MKTPYCKYIFLILFVMLITSCSNRGVSVIVKNETRYPMENTILEFTGGTKKIPKIEPGKSFTEYINPNGESSLTIKFNYNSKQYTEKLDVYFETNYKGNINIHLLENGKISYNSNVTI